MPIFLKSLKQEAARESQGRNSLRVRDHLANERTYLAWMRTAIALMGFGVLIARFRLLHPPLMASPPGNGWKLSLVFSFVGLVTVLVSTLQYFMIRSQIDRDQYQPADVWVILFSVLVVLLGAGVLYYVFTLPFSPIVTFE